MNYAIGPAARPRELFPLARVYPSRQDADVGRPTPWISIGPRVMYLHVSPDDDAAVEGAMWVAHRHAEIVETSVQIPLEVP